MKDAFCLDFFFVVVTQILRGEAGRDRVTHVTRSTIRI